MTAAVRESTLTCPRCGGASAETMPSDACLFFWDCPRCGARLKPKARDCCVFCSYGSVPCPPVQAAASRREDDVASLPAKCFSGHS